MTVELAPGQHSVTLESDLGSVTQTVTIEAGVPASLVVPLGATPGAVLSGWVSVNSPVVLELYEQGRLLGTSGIDRIMLPAGKHEIELASAALVVSRNADRAGRGRTRVGHQCDPAERLDVAERGSLGDRFG